MAFFVERQKDVQVMLKANIGMKKGKKIILNEIEALYLKEIKKYDFNVPLKKAKKYFIYRDLRMRNLYPVFYEVIGSSLPTKTYKGKKLELPKIKLKHYLSEDLAVVLKKPNKQIYEEYWFGQYGVYKRNAGSIHILDRFEALFLDEKGLLDLSNEEKKKLIKNYEDHYKVYSIWRENSFILKTGFKFGTDFRIYFPGVSPLNFKHSKHVLHVFPKGFNMRVEELSKSIRVANSVRKTFILAVPKERKKVKKDFFLLSRNREPLYLVKCFNQEDKISSKALSYLLEIAEKQKLKVLISIADRESSSTYYEVSKIKMENNDEFNFYEVKWINP